MTSATIWDTVHGVWEDIDHILLYERCLYYNSAPQINIKLAVTVVIRVVVIGGVLTCAWCAAKREVGILSHFKLSDATQTSETADVETLETTTSRLASRVRP